MPVRLVPVLSGKSIKLDKPILLVGRNPDCDVILKQSRKVSRTHCLIACVENTIVVRDLGSTNGVWLNSQRVERDARLSIGDELSVADVRYNLVRVEKTNGVKEARDDEARPAKSRKKNGRDAAASDQQRAQPLDAGQPVPVAIPDEDDSFVVEASAPRLPRVTPEALKQAVDDSVGESSRSQESPDDVLPELEDAPLALEDSLPELDNSLADLDEALSELDEDPPDIAAALPDLEDDSAEIFSLDLPEPLDMGDADKPILDGNAEPDDSSYDAPIIPLDD
jgi:pSer/pThr/pTyr-binding forkhead associated (FHA) protein